MSLKLNGQAAFRRSFADRIGGIPLRGILQMIRQQRLWPAAVTRAYSRIAPVYDCTVGIPFFLRVRDAFEKFVSNYGVAFSSAADIGCGTDCLLVI
jgi:hypothetical protein